MRIAIYLIFFGLVGCANADAWQKAPTPKLCQQLAKEEPHPAYGNMSKNYYLIVEELEKRDEDCSEYIKREMNRTNINNSTTVKIKN
ncbi:hypothetical protein N9L28_04745 [Luminiphilus sp.]|nr:hypothetical protein [Luminiphilus sp.]